MEIKEIIEVIRNTHGCEILPLNQQQTFPENLPEDLAWFFSNYGGISFFPEKDYGIQIVGADGFVNANLHFYPEDDVIWEELEGDISNDWYIVAQEESQDQYITIDLHPERLGQCYDSFLTIHADPCLSPVIARSFTDLLSRLLAAKGEYLYWEEEDFEDMGSAYEEEEG